MRRKDDFYMYDYVTDDLREAFNDVCMKEMGLDITDTDLIYDIDTNSILQIDGMYLKYCASEYDQINPNMEIRFSLIEDPKLMAYLTTWYCEKVINSINCKLLGLNHYIIDNNTYRGYATLTVQPNYNVYYNGEIVGYGCIREIRSGNYINESVRLLSLICNLNGKSNINLSRLDVM